MASTNPSRSTILWPSSVLGTEGGFVEASPDSVTAEVLDDAKPAPACSPLDRSTEVTKSGSRLRRVHGVALRKLGGGQEPGRNR